MPDNLKSILEVKANLDRLLKLEYNRDEVMLLSKIIDKVKEMTDTMKDKAIATLEQPDGDNKQDAPTK